MAKPATISPSPISGSSTLTELPLGSLILSSLNVRRTERDADIIALANDIAARGLKQNLVVIPAHFMTGEAKEGWDEKWEVIAGGRRLQAMQWLVQDGRLPEDHPVPCLLEDRADASETSLSENLHKVAMNPADEFAAFQQIVAEQQRKGLTEAEAVATTAKRFGATIRHVEGRLRLASLCPEVLDALRANVITLDMAKAYAGTADHAVQRHVFAQHQKCDWFTAKDIRVRLRGQTLPLDDALVTFVTLETYRAAGGRTEVEMFMGAAGAERVLDVALLTKLAQKIGDEAATALAKRDGYKAGLFTTGAMPKSPEGLHPLWQNDEVLPKAQAKKSIAVYHVDDGAVDLYFRFIPDAKRAEVPQRDWLAEREAQHRSHAIEVLAARKATGGFTGTPLEGRAFWPKYLPRLVEQGDKEGTADVAVLISVSTADIESHIAAATAEWDAQQAAKAEAEATADEAET